MARCVVLARGAVVCGNRGVVGCGPQSGGVGFRLAKQLLHIL